MRLGPGLLFVVVACRHDSGPPAGRSWTTAPQETVTTLAGRSLPRTVDRGGPILPNPRIATVTFTADAPALVERLEAFDDAITKTAWWRDVVDGHCTNPGRCIGDGAAGEHVHLTDTLPQTLHDDVLGALLQRSLPRSAAGTLFVVYLPPGVVLSDAFVPRYCSHDGKTAPRAFHRMLESHVPVAVVPRCSDEAELTAAASHEILEATTNPDPGHHGFAFEQGAGNLGFTAAGVEPVDPCGLITMDQHWTTASGFAVQRAWSNRAAAAGHEPCVPSRPERPYLALVPRAPAARLANVGDSVTVTVEATADRVVPARAISAFDLTGYQDTTSYVDVTLDRPTLSTGETATATLTLRAKNDAKLSIVGLVSTLGAQSWMWPLPVVMR